MACTATEKWTGKIVLYPSGSIDFVDCPEMPDEYFGRMDEAIGDLSLRNVRDIVLVFHDDDDVSISFDIIGPKYNWKCPHNWIAHHIMKSDDSRFLRGIIEQITSDMDDDTLQAYFEQDMIEDGFFKTLYPVCEHCGEHKPLYATKHGLLCDECKDDL